MATKTENDKAPDFGMCVNHPQIKAVMETDGASANKLAFCAFCRPDNVG